MTTNKLAIIGGSGLYDVEEFKDRELLDLNTPWGKPSDQILKTNYNNKEVYFLPRHGRGHFISPSNINFRANIDALKQLGVTDIVSVSAVGSLKENLPPEKFVIVDQFIDRTFARTKTFFDDEIVTHVSMAHPTSNGLMNACEDAIKKSDIDYPIIVTVDKDNNPIAVLDGNHRVEKAHRLKRKILKGIAIPEEDILKKFKNK